MIAHVYKPKRRKNGKLLVQRTYRGRYRLAGEFSISDVPLNTVDKQAAQSRLMSIIQEKEREKAGLKPAKSECEAMSKPTPVHLDDFVSDLKALGRSPQYQRVMKARINRLVAECGFEKLNDFSPDAFTTWRSKQTELGPKTLNEYLNFSNSFLNWVKRQGRIPSNPLATVTKVDMRGRQRRRRAITPEELPRLLKAAGKRRLLYLTAIYTGLRIDELRKMLWADLHLNEDRPFILTRACTTKNRKEAVVPLHPVLASELRNLPR